MNPVLIIAGLTIREAVRRRLIFAFVAITAVIVGLSAWGFDRLSHTRSLTSGETNLAIPQALILFMFMFSFVLALECLGDRRSVDLLRGRVRGPVDNRDPPGAPGGGAPRQVAWPGGAARRLRRWRLRS